MNRHKAILTLLTFLAPLNLLKAQTIDAGQIFSNTHGIKYKGFEIYEVEGYSVFISNHKLSFNEKGLNKIMKKYSINKESLTFNDTTFQTAKVFLKTKSRTKNIIESNIYYFFPQGDLEIKVIELRTINKRDEQLEKFFVKSILNNFIPNSVYTSMDVDSINFAGRIITLGSACQWKGTHNVQCSELGQMNWSEFRSIEKANKMLQAQFDITANKSIGRFLRQDTINIVFEGKETIALKIIYKIKIPRLIMGGSNILVIYYVATEVRGKFVSCVLSHFTDDVKANKLTPLLSEVMKVKE